MNRRAVVLGAGVTGLTVGMRLSEAGFDVEVVERESDIGGQARTLRHGDFHLDLGAHKIFTTMPHIQSLMQDLLGEDLLRRKKTGRIYYSGKYLPFPIGISDMVAATSVRKLTTLVASCLSSRLSGLFQRKREQNFEAWFIQNYGRAIYEQYVKEGTEKIWGTAGNLSADLAARRVTAPTLLELAKRYLLRQAIGRVTSAEYFWYPKEGCQMFANRLRERIVRRGGKVRTATHVDRIETCRNSATRIVLNDGASVDLTDDDVLVSTIPKRALVSALAAAVPDDVVYALAMLRERNLLLTYVFVAQASVMEENWIFFPERAFEFNRLFEQKNCSPYMCPKDRTVLCAETTFHCDQPLSAGVARHIAESVVGSLDRIGLIDRRHVTGTYSYVLEHAYPLWDVGYDARLRTVLGFVEGFDNIFSVGRQGAFLYGGIPDCMDVAEITANFIITRKPKRMWVDERKRFDNYVVVD